MGICVEVSVLAHGSQKLVGNVIFLSGAGCSEWELFPVQEVFLAAGATARATVLFYISHSSVDTVRDRPFSILAPILKSPLSTQEGLVFNQRLKWNLPLGAPESSSGAVPPLPEGSIPVGVGAQP